MVRKASSKDKWGFDLTHFGSSKRFEDVLKKHSLKTHKKECETFNKRKYCKFVWKNPKIKIVTGNNPITGEYSLSTAREPEKGYASYIGIEGNKDEVLSLVKTIKKKTKHIKDESPHRRGFI